MTNLSTRMEIQLCFGLALVAMLLACSNDAMERCLKGEHLIAQSVVQLKAKLRV